MKLARVLLIGSAIIFVAVGAAFLLIPKQYAEVIEISLPTAMARTDVRATYGGLELGFGIFLILCVVRREWTRGGTWALLLATGGFATGRLFGLLFERTLHPLMLVFLLIELVVTSLGVLALQRSEG
ncbi:MAG TPA: DUF4345 domain-containing protein [Pyrinomonadaceae bacterium]|nr:DUF4345 domain-containing protein [Pyrinomonadaceae bacterium]